MLSYIRASAPQIQLIIVDIVRITKLNTYLLTVVSMNEQKVVWFVFIYDQFERCPQHRRGVEPCTYCHGIVVDWVHSKWIQVD